MPPTLIEIALTALGGVELLLLLLLHSTYVAAIKLSIFCVSNLSENVFHYPLLGLATLGQRHMEHHSAGIATILVVVVAAAGNI